MKWRLLTSSATGKLSALSSQLALTPALSHCAVAPRAREKRTTRQLHRRCPLTPSLLPLPSASSAVKLPCFPLCLCASVVKTPPSCLSAVGGREFAVGSDDAGANQALTSLCFCHSLDPCLYARHYCFQRLPWNSSLPFHMARLLAGHWIILSCSRESSMVGWKYPITLRRFLTAT